jgi:hypothetical protein
VVQDNPPASFFIRPGIPPGQKGNGPGFVRRIARQGHFLLGVPWERAEASRRPVVEAGGREGVMPDLGDVG